MGENHLKKEPLIPGHYNNKELMYKEYHEFLYGLINSLENQLQNERQVHKVEDSKREEEEKIQSNQSGFSHNGSDAQIENNKLDHYSMKRLENKRIIQQTKMYLDFVK